MIGNLSQGTWYTNRTARHRDGTLALYVGHLITAIDTGQDMTAGDIHHGVTLYQTGRAQPVVLLGAAVSSLERIVAGTATEDVAVVGMTVSTLTGIVITVAFTKDRFEVQRVVRQELVFFTIRVRIFAIDPVRTLRHDGCLCLNLTGCGCCRIDEVCIIVCSRLTFAATNLTACNRHLRIVKHTTILTTAIDRCHDECRAIDSHVGLVDIAVEVSIVVRSRILYLTTAGTEDEAHIHGAVPLASLLEVTPGVLHTTSC